LKSDRGGIGPLPGSDKTFGMVGNIIPEGIEFRVPDGNIG
jgi:hypothetical protein